MIIWKLTSYATGGSGDEVAEHSPAFADAVEWIFERLDGDALSPLEVSTRVAAVLGAFALIAAENYTTLAIASSQLAQANGDILADVDITDPRYLRVTALSIAASHMEQMRREGRDTMTPPAEGSLGTE
jgi:hypothetical protein